MAVPLPGMNPYLEQPAFWSSFHSRLIVALADAIEAVLQPGYYVEVETRSYISDDDGEGELLIGIPDVVVAANPVPTPPLEDAAPSSGRLATQVRPQPVTLPILEEVTERYLEIRDGATGAVITALEVLSPKNKRSGSGRLAYETKRYQVINSQTHLIELDLLRVGKPMPLVGTVQSSDYRILVSHSEQRPSADLYGFSWRDPLPDIPVPLKLGDEPIVLGLQDIFAGVYDRGRYQARIDYSQPPPPPALTAADQDLLRQLLGPQNLS